MRNGQRNDCWQVQLPYSRAYILTFAPTPGHPRLLCTAANSVLTQDGIIAPPLFVAPVGTPLVGGDAACHPNP